MMDKLMLKKLEEAVRDLFMVDRVPIIWGCIAETRGCTTEEARQIYNGFCLHYSGLGKKGESSHDYLIRRIRNPRMDEIRLGT